MRPFVFAARAGRRARPARSRVLALALGLTLAHPGGADGPGLFDEHSILEIAIEAPWQTLLRERKERPTVDGVVVLRGRPGDPVPLEAKIRTRGKWRLENCSSPPYTVELATEQIAGTPFAGHPVLYVSTPCQKSRKYEQHLYQEYLIYRMYRLLTEASLRVRMLDVEYRDRDGARETWTAPAFVVEDIHRAAERLGRRWVEAPSVSWTALDRETSALFFLFQYMIGNTDWSVLRGPPDDRCCHNAALLEPEGSGPGWIPVPYDFDASGLVNTGDITPDPSLSISSVRQRQYRGLCLTNPQLEGALAAFTRARPELEALLDVHGLLTPAARRSTARYLEEFWDVVSDPKKLTKRVVERCRGSSAPARR